MATWRLPWSSGRCAPPVWTCCVARAWSWRTPSRRWTRRLARPSRGPNPQLHASSAQSGRSCPNGLIRSRSVSAGLACLDGGDELAAERWDVRDDAAPHQVAVAEGGLVYPGRARVHQVVLDAYAASGTLAVPDACRDSPHARR